MEEILHHLGCIKPCKQWDKLRINYLSTDAGFLPSTVFTDPQLIVNMPASPCHLTPIQSCSSSSICGGFKLPTLKAMTKRPTETLKSMKSWFLDEIVMFIPLLIKWMCAFCWPQGARKPPELSTFLGTEIPNVTVNLHLPLLLAGGEIQVITLIPGSFLYAGCLFKRNAIDVVLCECHDLYPWKHGWLWTEIHWEEFISSTEQDSSPTRINQVTSVWQSCQNPSSIQQSNAVEIPLLLDLALLC